jgi:hypothetical protein
VATALNAAISEAHAPPLTVFSPKHQ